MIQLMDSPWTTHANLRYVAAAATVDAHFACVGRSVPSPLLQGGVFLPMTQQHRHRIVQGWSRRYGLVFGYRFLWNHVRFQPLRLCRTFYL